MRRFELVTPEEWQGLSIVRHNHLDCQQAVEHLKREAVGAAVKMVCTAALLFRKREAMHRLAWHRKMKIEKKWRDGWLYVRRSA